MSELTDQQWEAAHAIARHLVQNRSDVAELKKSIAYLRTCVDKPNGGSKFFKYLDTWVIHGDKSKHSKQTVPYYKALKSACQILENWKDNPQAMLEILGWAGRLLPYHKSSPTAELANMLAQTTVEIKLTKQEQVQAAAAAAGFAVGQVVEATIENKDGNKITYSLAGGIRLTQKEPKRAGSLNVGDGVRVEITEMRETGVPKKLKLAE
jgi:hypothetical protein